MGKIKIAVSAVCILVVCFSGLDCIAQRSIGVRAAVSVPGVGMEAEYSLSPKHSFVLESNIEAGRLVYNDLPVRYMFYNNNMIDYRYYFNLHKRQEAGLHTGMNSGNYYYTGLLFRLNNIYNIENKKQVGYPVTSVAALRAGWGIQRIRPSGFYYGARLGGYFTFDKNITDGKLYPSVSIKCGISLFYRTFPK